MGLLAKARRNEEKPVPIDKAITKRELTRVSMMRGEQPSNDLINESVNNCKNCTPFHFSMLLTQYTNREFQSKSFASRLNEWI